MPTNNNFPNGYAFLVGIGIYKDINSLAATVNDATILKQILTDSNSCAYPQENVKCLLPEGDNYVTHDRFITELKAFVNQVNNNPDENKTVIIYYSGHGKAYKGNYYLQPYDAQRGGLGNCISAQTFTEIIDNIQAKRVIVLLDCCYAGGIKSEDNIADVLSQGKGKIIIASSTEEQTSMILGGSKYSLFTDILVKGLAGECMKHDNKETFVRILPLLSYIAAELRKHNVEQNLQINKADSLEDFPLCAFEASYVSKNPILRLLSNIFKNETNNIQVFKNELLTLLDQEQQNAIVDILPKIKDSGYKYNKVLYTDIKNNMGVMNLSLMAASLVSSTKTLIHSLESLLGEYEDNGNYRWAEKAKNSEIESKNKYGYLLHSIPSKMQCNNLHRCIIRIAFDEKKLAIDLPKFAKNIEIKDNVRITDSMEVSFQPSEYFQIISLSTSTQIIDVDSPTQWDFDVRPLKLGKFPITFKVVAILPNGTKMVVLTEQVNIVSEAVKGALEEFKISKIPIENNTNFMNKLNFPQEIKGISVALNLLIEKKNFFEQELQKAADVETKFSIKMKLMDMEAEISKYREKIEELSNKANNSNNIANITGTGNLIFQGVTNSNITVDLNNLQDTITTLQQNVETLKKKVNEGIRILFLSSMPYDQYRFQSDYEKIKEKCRKSIDDNELNFLLPCWETDYEKLLSELKDQKPNVLHYSGHGKEEGICLINRKNRLTQLLENDELEEIFENRSQYLQLVFLNSCFSETQAEIISQMEIYVLGIKGEVSPEIANDLSECFYAGFTVQEPPISVTKAIKIGCRNFAKNYPDNKDLISLWKDGIEIDYKTLKS